MESKRKILKYKKVCVFVVVLALVAITGCAAIGGKDLKEHKAIIDDYAAILLLQDQDSARFDDALAAVNVYLENPTAEQKDTTEVSLEEIKQQLQDDGSGYEPYEPTEELKQMLENQGISLAEYQLNADSRYLYLQGFVQDIAYLQEFLKYADKSDIFMEDLERVCSMMTEEQKYIRGYSYTSVNYWFAGWGEKEVAYVKEQVLDKLKSFFAEESQWYDDREVVEARMNTYLDSVKELDDQWAAYIGESKEEAKE